MNIRIYAIFDNKAEAYMEPFFAMTPGLALRAFADNTNNPQSIFNKHPEDFSLFEIGEFDDQKGEVIPHKTANNLGLAIQYMETKLEAVQ